MNRVVCPECKGKLDLDSRLGIGDEVTCFRTLDTMLYLRTGGEDPVNL